MKDEDVTRYIAEQISDVLSEAYEEFDRMGQVPKVNPGLPTEGIAEVSKMKDEELMTVTCSFIPSENGDSNNQINIVNV